MRIKKKKTGKQETDEIMVLSNVCGKETVA